MKEAFYYKVLKKGLVKCELCPRMCLINLGQYGFCQTRKNIRGKLYSMAYGRVSALHVDPIEKKPLYHFFPGTRAFSVGTVGCNLGCEFCQNWELARSHIREDQEIVGPQKIVNMAKRNGCKTIAYTYNEPTIFYEYMVDIAKKAKANGLKNVLVSNGYINQQPLHDLVHYIDAANIDLKAFNEKFYKKICGGELKVVLETLKILKKYKVWTEITNLIIPGENDDMGEIEEMCKWIKKNMGKSRVVLHFSRFFPMYKMDDEKSTPLETLKQAHAIAKKYLDYVYVGNLGIIDDTHCLKCDSLLIKRGEKSFVKNNKCYKCGNYIPGVFE